jgi:hypothetical protein
MLSIVFGIVQIAIWSAFPKWFTRFMFRIPILAIIANAIGSLLIMLVAGKSGIIGSANLAGSLIFALYVIAIAQGGNDETEIGI